MGSRRAPLTELYGHGTICTRPRTIGREPHGKVCDCAFSLNVFSRYLIRSQETLPQLQSRVRFLGCCATAALAGKVKEPVHKHYGTAHSWHLPQKPSPLKQLPPPLIL